MAPVTMCGIAGIISKRQDPSLRQTIVRMNDAIAHRGPDGEGFLLSDGTNCIPCSRNGAAGDTASFNYLPAQTIEEAQIDANIIFAHRRLSIIDLSPAGHEPMCDTSGKIWITFNGEIYNYIELRKVLESLGHRFRSTCDTEVIIYAYKEWGTSCVTRFDGMWAFCILDTEKKQCFASRDRLGVKPLYYVNNGNSFAFASEQKAFLKAGVVTVGIKPAALHNYLVNGLLETETDNFFEAVTELWPGTNLMYDLRSHRIEATRYFDIQSITNHVNEHLSDEQLTTLIRARLEENVKLRLRSDVEVGTCLSGGIDSSVLALLISRNTGKTFRCFTTAFPGQAFDESRFAATVATRSGAFHHITEPTVSELERDFDSLLYSQDTPIWDTSTYAQYRVMQLAHDHNVKVVLDGQGADELFTGYHHHFVAKWNNLLAAGRYNSLRRELSEARVSLSSPVNFYAKELIKARLRPSPNSSGILREDFVRSGPLFNWASIKPDVNGQLVQDISHTRLKIFLKCEDRCGMWHGVESRTPFSDDPDLISLLFSFSGNRKIRFGRLKYFLREAMKGELPEQIYNRFDKRGFETPMQAWVERMKPRMINEIREAQFDFVNPGRLKNASASVKTNKLLFRLFVLARWWRIFQH